MRDYELTVILDPHAEEEKLTATIDRITRWVVDGKGSVTQVEPQGKRRLAYPIKRFNEGNYVLFKFQGEQALARGMETNLKMSEDIVRYLLVRVEK
ncbi:MAG: 30S ribosomal protein S6 [Chloroflexi bacterium]|nr:30S ribosomal protein S6 [Chloroflexota bacterium]